MARRRAAASSLSSIKTAGRWALFADYNIGLGPGSPEQPRTHLPSFTMMRMRKRWLTGGAALVLAGIGAILLAAALRKADSPPPQRTTAVTLPTSPVALPQFSPAQFKQLLASLKGKPVVVNLWAAL